jgi:hypothetical protein
VTVHPRTPGSFSSSRSPGNRATGLGAHTPRQAPRQAGEAPDEVAFAPASLLAAGPRLTITGRLPRTLWYGPNPCIFRRVYPSRPLQLRCSAAYPPAPNSRVPPLTAPSESPPPAFPLAGPPVGVGPRSRMPSAETTARNSGMHATPALVLAGRWSPPRHLRAVPPALPALQRATVSRRSVYRSASSWTGQAPDSLSAVETATAQEPIRARAPTHLPRAIRGRPPAALGEPFTRIRPRIPAETLGVAVVSTQPLLAFPGRLEQFPVPSAHQTLNSQTRTVIRGP